MTATSCIKRYSAVSPTRRAAGMALLAALSSTVLLGLTCPVTVGTGCYNVGPCREVNSSTAPPYCHCHFCPGAQKFTPGTQQSAGSKYSSPVVQLVTCEYRRRLIGETDECSFQFCQTGELIDTWEWSVITSVTAGSPCGSPWD